jgi:flagellar motor component MotA
MLRAILGFFTFLVFILFGYFMEGGVLVVLLHTLPIFIVLVSFSVIAALLVIYPFSIIKQALRPDDSSNKVIVIRVWHHAERLSYLAGAMSTFLGLMIASRFLDQPINVVAAKFAASMVGILLGLLQGIFFRFLRARAE